MVSFASLEAIEAVISQLIVVGACAISRPAPYYIRPILWPLMYVCGGREVYVRIKKKEDRRLVSILTYLVAASSRRLI